MCRDAIYRVRFRPASVVEGREVEDAINRVPTHGLMENLISYKGGYDVYHQWFKPARLN